MYEQLIAPNLNIVGVPGECLVYVREIFGISAKYPTAAAGWENAASKFAGVDPPSDVAVPVWFSWETDGHVAVSVPGKGIYSTSADGDKVFATIQELLDFMGEGMKYLGWSEDVDGVYVVKPTADDSVTVKVNTGEWYVRSAANTGSPALGVALAGQEYAAVLVNGWAKITFRGQTGYLGPAAFKTA